MTFEFKRRRTATKPLTSKVDDTEPICQLYAAVLGMVIFRYCCFGLDLCTANIPPIMRVGWGLFVINKTFRFYRRTFTVEDFANLTIDDLKKMYQHKTIGLLQREEKAKIDSLQGLSDLSHFFDNWLKEYAEPFIAKAKEMMMEMPD